MTVHLTQAIFDDITKLVCPYCKSGHEPTRRVDTLEWTHTITHPMANAKGVTHTICWATGLRNSDYAPSKISEKK